MKQHHRSSRNSSQHRAPGAVDRNRSTAPQRGGILSWALLFAICLVPARASSQVPTADPNWRSSSVGTTPNSQEDNSKLGDNQRKMLKARFEKTRSDAVEMAALAKKLREELDKPNSDAFSPEVVSLADKIEKLARKIRGESEGF